MKMVAIETHIGWYVGPSWAWGVLTVHVDHSVFPADKEMTHPDMRLLLNRNNLSGIDFADINESSLLEFSSENVREFKVITFTKGMMFHGKN